MMEGSGQHTPERADPTGADDLAAMLKEFGKLGTGKNASLDDLVSQIGAALADELAQFSGERARVEKVDLNSFHKSDNLPGAGKNLAVALFEADEDEAVALITLDADAFRRVLRLAIGNPADPASLQAELSFAEQRLFMRLAERLARSAFECAGSSDHIALTRTARYADETVLGESLTGAEMVKVGYEIAFKSTRVLIAAVLAMDILSPEPAGDGEPVVDSDEQLQEWAWQQKLQEAAKRLPVPMVAELALAEMPLAEIAGLEPGQSFSLPGRTDTVRVVDTAGATGFIARLEMDKGKLYLRVAGGKYVG